MTQTDNNLKKNSRSQRQNETVKDYAIRMASAKSFNKKKKFKNHDKGK